MRQRVTKCVEFVITVNSRVYGALVYKAHPQLWQSFGRKKKEAHYVPAQICPRCKGFLNTRLSSSGVVEKRFLLRGPDEMLDSFAAPWSPSFRKIFSELLGESFLDYYSKVSRMIEAFSHVSESKSPTMPSALRTTPFR